MSIKEKEEKLLELLGRADLNSAEEFALEWHKTNAEEFFEFIMTIGDYSAEDDNRLEVFLDLLNDKICMEESENSGGKDSFRYAYFSGLINHFPNKAHQKFVDEILPEIKRTKYVDKYIVLYCRELVPQIYEAHPDQVLDIFSETLKMVNRYIDDEKEMLDALSNVTLHSIKIGLSEEVYNYIIKNPGMPEKAFIMAYIADRLEDLDKVEAAIIYLKEFWTQQKTYDRIDAFLPEIVSFLEEAKESLLKNPINLYAKENNFDLLNYDGYQVVNIIYEYLSKYSPQKISNNRELLLEALIALKNLPLDKFYDNAIYYERAMELYEKAHRRNPFRYEDEQLKKIEDWIERLEAKQEDLFLKECSENTKAIIDKSSPLLIKFDPTVADKLVEEFIGDKRIFEQLKLFDDVIRNLRTAEWVWNHYLRGLPNPEDEMLMDHTFAVASYFKAVEYYIYLKITALCANQYLWGYERDNQGNLKPKDKNILISKDNAKWYRCTLGDYYKHIELRGEQMLKNKENARKVSKKIRDWTDKCRNSKLHKTPVLETAAAEEIRNKSRELLIFLVKEFKE